MSDTKIGPFATIFMLGRGQSYVFGNTPDHMVDGWQYRAVLDIDRQPTDEPDVIRRQMVVVQIDLEGYRVQRWERIGYNGGLRERLVEDYTAQTATDAVAPLLDNKDVIANAFCQAPTLVEVLRHTRRKMLRALLRYTMHGILRPMSLKERAWLLAMGASFLWQMFE